MLRCVDLLKQMLLQKKIITYIKNCGNEEKILRINC